MGICIDTQNLSHHRVKAGGGIFHLSRSRGGEFRNSSAGRQLSRQLMYRLEGSIKRFFVAGRMM